MRRLYCNLHTVQSVHTHTQMTLITYNNLLGLASYCRKLKMLSLVLRLLGDGIWGFGQPFKLKTLLRLLALNPPGGGVVRPSDHPLSSSHHSTFLLRSRLPSDLGPPSSPSVSHRPQGWPSAMTTFDPKSPCLLRSLGLGAMYHNSFQKTKGPHKMIYRVIKAKEQILVINMQTHKAN